jgi:cell division protein FtsZ
MDLGMREVLCIAVDSDRYALHIARADSKLLVTHAADAGTHGDVAIGRALGLRATSKLQSTIGGAEIVFMLAGMGGGTGGGAAPVIAENARKNGALVVGLVTKPFHHEHSRFHAAVSSVRKMLDACDTLILIDNHSFESSSITLPFGLSPDSAAQTCCSVVQSLAHAFSGSELCNAEVGELRTLLRRGGLAKATIGHSHSHLGAEEASLRALRNTIAHDDISHANGAYVNVTGGNHVQRKHVDSAVGIFSRRLDPSAQFLYGHRVDPNMAGVTRVTFLATGLSFPYCWREYRKLPLVLDDLEPESAEEEDLALKLDLPQLESFVN